MTGKTDMRTLGAEARKEVFNIAVPQTVDGKAETAQSFGQHMLRAAIRGRHRITTDQRLRQREWVG
jgi:hypothetical protein